MNNEKSFICFSHVTKKFDEFKALNDVSLEIPRGCFMTLLGPSGCGKTTLMRQLAGFSEPDDGQIFVNGRKMNGLPPYKRGTPLVFQEYALFPHMTVYENISYGLRLNKVSKQTLDQKVAEMVAMFNLSGMEERFPKQLSGGQQQRVAFARALIMGEDVLLLDEPLSNLDAKLRVDVRSELRQIQQKLGITVIYVTHDQDEALSMSDQIAVMKQGCIQQVGTPWQVYFRPKNRFVADFVGTVNFGEASVIKKESGRAEVCWNDMRFSIPCENEDIHDGDLVELVIRPEAILIDKDKTDAAPDVFEGTVTFFSFLGRYIRYFISVNGITLIVDDSNPNIHGAVTGIVRLHLDYEKLHILPRKEAVQTNAAN